MRRGAVSSGFMHLHFIMWFSYYTYQHLHLLRSVLARCGAVLASFSVVSVKLTPLLVILIPITV